MTFDATNSGTATINGNINLNSAGTAGVTRTFTINDGAAAIDTRIGGVISDTTNNAALTKAGTGTLVLTGQNTYRGGTSVTGGSFFVNNTAGSGTGTGSITVTGSGTTLGGSGIMTGTVSVASGNNLAPGASGVGSTAILKTGALTLSSGSNFQLDINGTTVGAGYDQLGVTGGVINIAGSNLSLTIGASFTQADVGDQFAILSNISPGAINGMFSGLTEGSSFNSGADQFMITYFGNASDGTNGNDIVLTLTAVPEPSTWVAAGLSLLVVAYSQRRRFARAINRVGC